MAPTEEPAQQTKPVGPQPKLRPDMPVDYWKQRFQDADPNQYHQFKNKDPEKKDRMAIAAYYDARQPKASKK